MATSSRARASRFASPTILVVSLALVGFVLLRLYLRFERDTLMPAANERYDVTDVYVAPLATVCPSAAKTLAAADFAACLPRLSLAPERRGDAFLNLKLPSVADTLAGQSKSFKQVLREQANETVKNAFRSLAPVVIGFRVPRAAFVRNVVGIEPQVLVLDGMQDGRICYLGQCPYLISAHDQYLLPFPLLLPAGETATGGDMVDVFIFAKDTRFAYGPYLDDGIFVTRYSQMHFARKLYPVLVYGQAPALALSFIGLFLMALGFAAIWSEFADYGSFCYLTASFALLVLCYEPSLLVTSLDPTVFRKVLAFASVNLPLAAAAFALATNRVSGRKLLTLLFGGLVAAAAIAAKLPERHIMLVINATSLALAAVPCLIAFTGGVRCYRAYRRAAVSGPLSLRLDFRRRALEQVCYGICLLLIGLQLVQQSFRLDRGALDLAFAPMTGLLLFIMFAVLLYHSTAKLAKTHFRTDGRSEAVRLKGRMTARRYLAWLAETRQGVMVQVDLRNSSLAASSLKNRIHFVMERLCDAMHECYGSRGYHWVLAKKNGDEWIVILSQKHASLKDDLTEVVQATVGAAGGWAQLVQQMAPETSIHVNVFALSAYSLGSAAVRAARSLEDERSWDTVDFASREANYLMKWGGKSRCEDAVTIGGNALLLAEEVRAAALQTDRLAKIIASAGDVSPASLLDVESLNLVYAYLPWKATEPAAPHELAS